MQRWSTVLVSTNPYFYPPQDQAGIQRLVQYMVRCPFSLSRLVKVTDTGQVVYKAEKQACQAFPDPYADDLKAEVDPLSCPQCGGQMKVVAFIEPPQGKVVEKILRGHQSGADQRFASVPVGRLWQARAARAPPEVEDLVLDLDVAYSDSSPDQAGQFQELTYVDIDTFLATF